MTPEELVVWGCALVFASLFFWWNITTVAPWSALPVADAVVVASSVVAQILLGKGKYESWVLWLGPVNMLSIYLFLSMGWYTAALLYVAFFVHAAWAIVTWRKEAYA